MSHVLDILHERGFIKQIMGEDKLKEKMSNGPMTFYIGFDPTGDCLHVGHLLPIMCMAWLQKSRTQAHYCSRWGNRYGWRSQR